MLAAIASALGGQIVDGLLGRITGLFESYFKKQISMEELRAGMMKALLETFAEVEKYHADALAKTYASFMQAMVQSKLMQCVWAAVVISQLIVLVWHQAGIPALCYSVGKMNCYPSSGSTVEWSYALIAACLGMGPVILRTGPAAGGNLLDKLKATIGK